MDQIQINRLATDIKNKRAGRGIREVAKEIGISPATLSRVENENIPDLDTFGKICKWLCADPAEYLGLRAPLSSQSTLARVHFKKEATIKQDSAVALGEMILLAQAMLKEEEELQG